MNSTELHDRFRSDTRDLGDPPLWTSPEIFNYINDAQNMFCRLTGGLADASSSITSVPFLAGQTWIDLSQRILKLRMVQRASDYHTVDILNFEDLENGSYVQQDYGMMIRSVRLDNTTGRVFGIVVGMEPNKARLVYIPAEDDALNLTVYRLPLEPITAKGQDLEIEEQHHEHLLTWVKRCAHMKQDAETYDRGKAERFEQQFLAYCNQAKLERERREHKYRSVAYGGY